MDSSCLHPRIIAPPTPRASNKPVFTDFSSLVFVEGDCRAGVLKDLCELLEEVEEVVRRHGRCDA